MPFTLPALTTDQPLGVFAAIWANFKALAAATFTTPTGTGFVHVTGGVLDGAALSIIKSMQKVSITIANTATTGTATITAVNLSNAFVAYGGSTIDANDTNPKDYMATVALTNTTTVTATRTGGANNVVVAATVVEYN